MQKVEPCPMCGRFDGDSKEKWERREDEIDKINLILAGILFSDKATTRQKEIFMAKYYFSRGSLEQIGDDFDLNKMTVKEHLDKATDLLADTINTLTN